MLYGYATSYSESPESFPNLLFKLNCFSAIWHVFGSCATVYGMLTLSELMSGLENQADCGPLTLAETWTIIFVFVVIFPIVL